MGPQAAEVEAVLRFYWRADAACGSWRTYARRSLTSLPARGITQGGASGNTQFDFVARDRTASGSGDGGSPFRVDPQASAQEAGYRRPHACARPMIAFGKRRVAECDSGSRSI